MTTSRFYLITPYHANNWPYRRDMSKEPSTSRNDMQRLILVSAGLGLLSIMYCLLHSSIFTSCWRQWRALAVMAMSAMIHGHDHSHGHDGGSGNLESAFSLLRSWVWGILPVPPVPPALPVPFVCIVCAGVMGMGNGCGNGCGNGKAGVFGTLARAPCTGLATTDGCG